MLTVVFQVEMPCGPVGGYQHFRRNISLDLLTLKMVAVYSSQTMVTTYRTIQTANQKTIINLNTNEKTDHHNKIKPV